MHCAIWYDLYNLKIVKNNHGRTLIYLAMIAKGVLLFDHQLACSKQCLYSWAYSYIQVYTLNIIQVEF